MTYHRTSQNATTQCLQPKNAMDRWHSTSGPSLLIKCVRLSAAACIPRAPSLGSMGSHSVRSDRPNRGNPHCQSGVLRHLFLPFPAASAPAWLNQWILTGLFPHTSFRDSRRCSRTSSRGPAPPNQDPKLIVLKSNRCAKMLLNL